MVTKMARTLHVECECLLQVTGKIVRLQLSFIICKNELSTGQCLDPILAIPQNGLMTKPLSHNGYSQL